jgi:flagellar biosynthesis protein FliQ
MQLYNKIMLYFWLVVGIVSLIVVSFNCITVGVDKWGLYFSMPLIAFLMFFFKRWMMKRMEKHMKFLESQQKTKE